MCGPYQTATRETTRKEWYFTQACRLSADSFRELAQILHMAHEPLANKSIEEIEEDLLAKIYTSFGKAMKDLGDVLALLRGDSMVNYLLKQNEKDDLRKRIEELEEEIKSLKIDIKGQQPTREAPQPMNSRRR